MKAYISFAILMAISNIVIGKNINSYPATMLPSEVYTHSDYSKIPSEKSTALEIAISDSKKALKLAKKEKDTESIIAIYATLGASYLELNDLESAEKYTSKGYKLNPNHTAILYNLVLISFHMDQPDAVIQHLNTLVEFDPEFIKLYNHLGKEYALKGNHEKALEFFDIAIKKDPKNNIVFSNRSNSRLALGDVDGAVEDIKVAIRKDGTSSWAYKVRGLISVEKEDMRRACFDFRLANELETEKLEGPAASVLIDDYCSKKK